MEKKESGVLSLVERVQADGFELIIKTEPEEFQLVATEGAQQLGIIKAEAKKLKKTGDVLPVHKEILEQQKRNTGDSSDENSFEPLESDIKIESPEFYYPKSPEQRVLTPSSIAREPRMLKLNHKGPYTCDICAKICSNRYAFCCHMRYKHMRAPHLFCDLCPRTFYLKTTLKKHLVSHVKFKAYVCNVCGFETKYKARLRNHKIIHQKKTKCSICNKLVSTVKTHMKYTHSTKSLLPCKICGKKLNKDSLKRHIRKVHEKPNDRYRCAKCTAAFCLNKELNQHVLKAHFDGKLFECHCGSVFRETKGLKRHMVKLHS